MDGILGICAEEVLYELKQLMVRLDPAVDLTTAEAVAILAILRGANARLGYLPVPPQPSRQQPRTGRRLQSV